MTRPGSISGRRRSSNGLLTPGSALKAPTSARGMVRSKGWVFIGEVVVPLVVHFPGGVGSLHDGQPLVVLFGASPVAADHEGAVGSHGTVEELQVQSFFVGCGSVYQLVLRLLFLRQCQPRLWSGSEPTV